VAAREAAVAAARSAVRQAELDLSYAQIRAPATGVVGRRAAEPGQRVQPGQQLIAVVALDDLWVTANFKETQLRHLTAGQSARIAVDASGHKLDGYVESLGGATGARFSLLPPENATGNYVKVVQRVPVRLRFRSGQRGLERLRPGMSVVPKVWVR
jgi:membrane fusion protein (multidrug efflux system)